MSTPPAVEKELQRLRRLPENRICPNCEKKDTSFGFQAVCMVFKTFVCGDCKSAHQSFSHRSKSVSMSIWNMKEVQSLEERNDGGNLHAVQKWIANAPESIRPCPDSHVNEKKKFVDRAYNKKEWECTVPRSDDNVKSTESQPLPQHAAQQNTGAQKSSVAKEPRVEACIHAQAPMVNLLDDDSFSSPPVAAAPQNAVIAPASSCNLLDDQFFSPQPVSQNNAAMSPDTTSSGGPSASSAFSFIAGASNAPSAGSAFSFIGASQADQQVNQPASQVSFDPFATPGLSVQQQQPQPQPSSCMSTGAGAWQNQQQQQPQQQQLQQQLHQQPSWTQQGSMVCPQMMNNGPAGALQQQQQQRPGWAQQGNMAFPQMASSYGTAGGASFGQPWQSSPAPAFAPAAPAMVTGYPGQCAANAPMAGFAAPGMMCSGTVSTGQAQSRSMPSNQASAFDSFDPFAPDPISVRG